MWFIVQKTKMGTAMRAVSFNEQAAALMGVNVNKVISFTFGLGSALAAVAGIFYAMRAPGIEPLMGIQPACALSWQRCSEALGIFQVPRLEECSSACSRRSSAACRRYRITAMVSPSRSSSSSALQAGRIAGQSANREGLMRRDPRTWLLISIVIAVVVSLYAKEITSSIRGGTYYWGIVIDIGSISSSPSR
jgi:hypothetical protein